MAEAIFYKWNNYTWNLFNTFFFSFVFIEVFWSTFFWNDFHTGKKKDGPPLGNLGQNFYEENLVGEH